MTTDLIHGATTDKGYAKNRTGAFERGVRVVLLLDTYSYGPVSRDETGTIISVSNGGFRGIEASVRLDGDGRQIANVNLDILGVVQ